MLSGELLTEGKIVGKGSNPIHEYCVVTEAGESSYHWQKERA